MAAGLTPHGLPGGTGLVCDVGDGDSAVALRADLDALPIVDGKSTDYASTVPGVCHACGHDVHTATVLGAGLVLADLAREGRLPAACASCSSRPRSPRAAARWRSWTPGDSRAWTGSSRCTATRATTVGQVGLRAGAITGSADHLVVRLTGPGGHTARPHLTADLVYALGAW